MLLEPAKCLEHLAGFFARETMSVAATSGAVFMVIFIANNVNFDHAVRVCGQNRRYSQ